MSSENDERMHESASTKEKVCLYLPVEIVKKLEEMIFHARKDIPRDKARQLTKSKLTELVLAAIINEYDKGNGKGVINDIIFNWVES
ncbi:MAG: hypothetical protein ACR2N3_12640 [Pyrinomonadaceae bacterium]